MYAERLDVHKYQLKEVQGDDLKEKVHQTQAKNGGIFLVKNPKNEENEENMSLVISSSTADVSNMLGVRLASIQQIEQAVVFEDEDLKNFKFFDSESNIKKTVHQYIAIIALLMTFKVLLQLFSFGNSSIIDQTKKQEINL